MSVNEEINVIAQRVKKEVNKDVNLSIGNIENIAEAVPILCERMDNICGLMDYQATLISISESALEEAKFRYKKKELIAKQKFNQAFVDFKQEDRPKPRNERRTDKEYEALAELEASVDTNEALNLEKEYLKTQHGLSDAKHHYEVLNNHFLSYRKACDLLTREFSKIGDFTVKHQVYNPGGVL